MKMLLLAALLSLVYVSLIDSTIISYDGPTPPECLGATNLTEYWRRNRGGNDIRPGGPHSSRGWACDFHKDLQWFRFTGSAGNRMLDVCPLLRSCGTSIPYWTDDEAPKAVGVAATINVYASWSTFRSCKYSTKKVQAMRCSLSAEHDLIYKYNGPYESSCASTFCGTL